MRASLSFLDDLPLYETEKPYELWLPKEQLPKEIPLTNCQYREHKNVEIHDIRSSDLDLGFKASDAGFNFLHDPLEFDFRGEHLLSSDGTMLRKYLSRTVQKVQQEFSADKVLCFDWRYRKAKQPPSGLPLLEYIPVRERPLRTAHVVHVDDSPAGGKVRLERHLTSEELVQFHDGKLQVRFVNFWRPLIAQVEDTPLALCDRRTVKDGDIVLVDKIQPDYVNEGLYLKHRPYHRWYWLSGQTKSEPFMFVTWDSEAGDVQACPPHAAFDNPRARLGHPPRESVEVRLMVLNAII